MSGPPRCLSPNLIIIIIVIISPQREEGLISLRRTWSICCRDARPRNSLVLVRPFHQRRKGPERKFPVILQCVLLVPDDHFPPGEVCLLASASFRCLRFRKLWMFFVCCCSSCSSCSFLSQRRQAFLSRLSRVRMSQMQRKIYGGKEPRDTPCT